MNGLVLALTVGLAGLAQASSVGVEAPGTLSPRVEATGPGAGTDRGIQPDRRQGPFQKLFGPPPAPALAGATVITVPAGASKTRAPRIVCGMVVIPTDPALDPHMVIRPKEPAASSRIRRIPATACVD